MEMLKNIFQKIKLLANHRKAFIMTCSPPYRIYIVLYYAIFQKLKFISTTHTTLIYYETLTKAMDMQPLLFAQYHTRGFYDKNRISHPLYSPLSDLYFFRNLKRNIDGQKFCSKYNLQVAALKFFRRILQYFQKSVFCKIIVHLHG